MKRLSLITLLLVCHSAQGFFRVPVFFDLPTPVTPWYFIGEILALGSHTRDGYNTCGDTVNVLNIYGKENLKDLASGVPEDILERNPNSILNTLPEQTTGEDFAQLCWSGALERAQIAFYLKQNFIHGWFIEFFAPFNCMVLNNIKFTDLSTPEEAGTVNFDDWEAFMARFAANMEQYGVIINKKFSTYGVGDMEFDVGWAGRWYDRWCCRFIQVTARIGLFLQTGNQREGPEVFQLTRGDNDFRTWGGALDIFAQVRPWVGFGAQANVLVAQSRDGFIGMKTDDAQNGYIKLTKGNARISKDPFVRLMTFVLIENTGWSPILSTITLGLTYNNEGKRTIQPKNPHIFSFATVNTDIIDKGSDLYRWHMILRHNFTNNKWYKPNVAFFIHSAFKGKRTPAGTLYQAGTGFSTHWCF